MKGLESYTKFEKKALSKEKQGAMVLYTLSFGTPRSSFRVEESSIIPLNFNLNLIMVHVYYWIRNCRKKC